MQWDDSVPKGAVCIPLRARDGSVRAYALVDAADADWVNQWRWSLSSGYAARGVWSDGRTRLSFMHRDLLGLVRGDGVEVDHIDRVILNNQRGNLRTATRRQNAQNMPPRMGMTSKYRGVYWSKASNRWVAQIGVKRKRYFLGGFDSEQEAAEVARAARAIFLPFSTD